MKGDTLPTNGPMSTVVYLLLGEGDEAENMPLVSMTERFTDEGAGRIRGTRTWNAIGGDYLAHVGSWQAKVIDWTWGEPWDPEEDT